MNSLTVKIGALAIAASVLLPAAAWADTAPATKPTAAQPLTFGSAKTTNVNGVIVPGVYVINADSKVAWVPGVGLVVVNASTALPKGAVYVTSSK